MMAFGALLMSACQQDATMVEVEEQQPVVETVKKAYTTHVSKEDAMRVAGVFNSGEGAVTRTDKTIKEVTAMTDDAGNPLLYVVNYADNRGFVLISATKNYLPVLAYNNVGNFATSQELHPVALQVWMTDVKGCLEMADAQPADSTAVYRRLWQRYEEHPETFAGVARTRGTTDAVDEMVMSYMGQWHNEGYNCDLLVDAQSYLPSDVYARFCAAAEGSILPIYDWTQYAVVRNKYIEEEERVDNLLKTQWDTEFAEGLIVDPAVIAVGQVMKYYEKPNSFPWSNIPVSGDTEGAKTFISDINAGFANQYTASKIATILSAYGYSTAAVANHSASTVSFNLAQKHPVIMTGTNASGIYHTWVASGYRDVDYSHPYELYVPTHEGTFACVDSYMELSGSNFYTYMNWGNGGDNDGFFTESNSIYTRNRQDVVNIYH